MMSDKDFKAWQANIKHPHRNVSGAFFESMLELQLQEACQTKSRVATVYNKLLQLQFSYNNDKNVYVLTTFLDANAILFYERGKELDIPNKYGTII